MKSFKFIQLNLDKEIAILWLNRPEVHNALNIEMLREIILCLKKIDRMPDIRIVLIKSTGNSFCSGADISQMLQFSGKGTFKNLRHSKLLAKCFNSIYGLNKPVISVVQGPVIAGGTGITSASDLVIANRSATFSIPEARIGLIPSTILPYILNRISQQQAKILMFTGRKIDAVEAQSMGLVDFLYTDDELDKELHTLIDQILQSAPNSIKEIKALMNELTLNSINELNIKKTIKALTRVKKSKDAKEGLKAYMEKRKPAWNNNL